MQADSVLGIFLFCGAAVFGLCATAFWVWMLIDCAVKEPSEGNEKVVWVIIIALASWIGALIYFFARRPERIALYGR